MSDEHGVMGDVFDHRLMRLNRPALSIVSDGSGGPAVQVEIGMLVFRCPATDKDIPSGIELDRETFRKTRQFRVTVRCRPCRQLHQFYAAVGILAPFGSGNPQRCLVAELETL